MAFHLVERASLIVSPDPYKLHSPKHRPDLGGISVNWQRANGSYRRSRNKKPTAGSRLEFRTPTGVGKSAVPEPRGAWAELWGKRFWMWPGGEGRSLKADISESGLSGFRPRKRTPESGRAGFGTAMSGYGRAWRERVCSQARVRAGSREGGALPGHGVSIPGASGGGGGARG